MEDDDGNTFIGPQYCQQAIADVAFYRLVALTGWTPRQLEEEVSAADAARLLRADSAHTAAKAEADWRARPRDG